MLNKDSLQPALTKSHAKHDENCAERITTALAQDDIDGYGAPQKSRVIKRSIVIGGHRTSVSLEDDFWLGLKSIAQNQSVHLSDIVRNIDSERQHCNLSSAIRLYVFAHFHK
jgi:predicted DNA-binding ribbon-helix-helix protein